MAVLVVAIVAETVKIATAMSCIGEAASSFSFLLITACRLILELSNLFLRENNELNLPEYYPVFAAVDRLQ